MNLIINGNRQGRLHLAILLFLYGTLMSAQLPSGFTDIKVQGGYTTPMGVIFSTNGQKMFVWEKKGILWVSNWNGVTYIKQTTPVIDISEEVGDWSDLGFHSVALDPNFDSNGLIYLFYQVDRHHLMNFGTSSYDATKDEYFDATISRVTRYRVSLNSFVADKTSRKILIGESKSTGIPVLHQSHAGGQLIFGTDGTLLLATGDASSFTGADVGNAPESYYQNAINDGIIRSTENVGAFRAQQINSHCGKILRIDPSTGNGLSSNPYYDSSNPRSAQSRVWALGLRNPYRMALKTGTGSSSSPGTILVADVQAGGNEELNVLEKAGLNCGWPVFEGLTRQGAFTDNGTRNAEEAGSPTFESLCKSPTTASISSNVAERRFTFFPPALDWSHSEKRTRNPDFSSGSLRAVIIGTAGSHVIGTSFTGACGTSGCYYTGNAFPQKYRNVFFFGDYEANWIKAVSLHDNSDHQAHEVLDFAPDGYTQGVVDIEYCPLDQSIFYVNINTGDIQKISFGGNTNRPPVAVAKSNKTSGASPLTVTFTGNESNDPDGDPLSYTWDFGDGSTSSSANPTYTFTSTGSRGFTVKLTVKDDKGLSDSKNITISTNNTPPSVKITNPTNNSKYTLSQATNYTLNATVTDNDASNMKYAWQLTLKHNNHEHREPINTQQSPTVTIAPVGCDGETYSYLIEVTVTDNGGLTAKDAVTIVPDCASGSLSVKNISATSDVNASRVSWTNPSVSFDEVMVVAKENTGFSTNPSGTNYSASSNFAGSGSSFEGGKVVYKGTGTSVTVSNLIGGTKYFFRVFARKGSVWTGGVETSATPTTNAPVSSICNGDGRLYVEKWNNIPVSGCVSSIPINTPPNSAQINTYSVFETARDIGDRFGERVRGYICAPETGAYTFYISSNEGGALFLSTNSDPNNKRQIAEIPDCRVSFYRQWGKFPEQKSGKINLVAGQRYYIEVLYKDAYGGDHMSIGWQRPSNSTIAVVPASSFTAFNPSSTPTITSEFDPNKCYKITTKATDKIIEVANRSTSLSASIQLGTYAVGLKHQLWKIKHNGDGTHQLVNANSGKVADVLRESLINGANIAQFDWNGGDNQRWKLTKGSDGLYTIAAKHSNLLMDIYNNTYVNGTPLIQATPDKTNSQYWRVESVGCPVGVVSLLNENILSADGYKDGKKAIINWISNANQNKDYFIVERLNFTNGEFEQLEVVNADYNQSGNISYSVVDNNPSNSENRYRVVLRRDNTDTPQYSEIIMLDFSQYQGFSIFPNPAQDYLDINVEDAGNQKVDIIITNVMGQVMRQKKLDVAPKAPLRMPLEGLDNGSYLLRMKVDGKRELVKQFVILR